jgi:hypothetical protein
MAHQMPLAGAVHHITVILGWSREGIVARSNRPIKSRASGALLVRPSFASILWASRQTGLISACWQASVLLLRWLAPRALRATLAMCDQFPTRKWSTVHTPPSESACQIYPVGLCQERSRVSDLPCSMRHVSAFLSQECLLSTCLLIPCFGINDSRALHHHQ